MDIIRVFADNLKRYRVERGFSQEHLAELCGLHRTYISDIERGTRNVSLENVQRLALALELAPSKLLEEDHT